MFAKLLKGAAGISVTAGTAASAYVVYTMKTDPLVSHDHTFASAGSQLFTNKAMVTLGRRQKAALDASCSAAARVNQDLLMELVHEGIDNETVSVPAPTDFLPRTLESNGAAHSAGCCAHPLMCPPVLMTRRLHRPMQ